MTRKEKFREQLVKARKLHGSRYSYSALNEPTAKDYVVIGCPSHGPFTQTWASHLQGHGCPACGSASRAKKIAHTPEVRRRNFIEKATAIHGAAYGYDSVDYSDRNMKAKVDILCPVHGVFQQTYGNHVTLKHGCPQCAKDAIADRLDRRHGPRPIKLARFLAAVRDLHGGRYTYPFLKKELVTTNSKVTVRCPDHGDFKQIAHNHARGHGCRLCKVSAGEDNFLRWLKSVVPKGTVVEGGNRSILSGKEIDIWLPSHKVAIEYNGTYYHSSSKVGKNYHADKQRRCSEIGVKLLTIFEFEWLHERLREIVKGRVLNALGLLSPHKIPSRKCDVRVIESSEGRAFFEDNHIKGPGTARLYLGLFHQEELVAAMSLGVPRFSKKYEWEVIRVCSKTGVLVHGSFAKLFSFFVKTYDPASVVNYSDLRWGTGASCMVAGFKRVGVTAPAVWYAPSNPERRGTVDGRPLSRLQVQKHKLPSLLSRFDPEETADENLHRHHYISFYDCGNVKYEWLAA